MRKTAKMKEEDKPKAAEAILKNAYVDSVKSAEEAKVLIKEVDEILETGGFHVKQWISSSQANATEEPNEVVLGGQKSCGKKFKDLSGFPRKIPLILRSRLNWRKGPRP